MASLKQPIIFLFNDIWLLIRLYQNYMTRISYFYWPVEDFDMIDIITTNLPHKIMSEIHLFGWDYALIKQVLRVCTVKHFSYSFCNRGHWRLKRCDCVTAKIIIVLKESKTFVESNQYKVLKLNNWFSW